MKKSSTLLCILLLLSLSTITVTANGRDSGIKSHGTLEAESSTGDNVLLRSEDLRSIAKELDLLENSYKSTAKNSLSTVGSTPISDRWDDICYAIEHSQDCDVPATADNISNGKQAWVNGKLITGNGKDASDGYDRGHEDGYKEGMANLPGGNQISISNGYTFTRDYDCIYILALNSCHDDDSKDERPCSTCNTGDIPGATKTVIINSSCRHRGGQHFSHALTRFTNVKSGTTYTGTGGRLIY